jgi:hypothetical protein
MEKLTKETFQKWQNWIEKIENDLQHIINYQQIYKSFIETVNANIDHINENNGILFCDFVRECYATYAMATIRRHSKIERDSISLMKLLDQLKKSSSQFTDEFYLQQYPLEKDELEWQKSTFESFSKNGKCLSEEIISSDMQTIKEIAGRVSDFVDRAIAHLDQRGIGKNITYEDVTDSVDLFNEITCKYITLITSIGYITLKPIIQFDWEKIFTVPLNESGYRRRKKRMRT